MKGYASLASAMVRDDGGLVTPFAVRTSRTSARDKGSATAGGLRALNDTLVRLGHDTQPIHRVADTIPNGVGQLADEMDATLLVAPVALDEVISSLAVDGELGRIAAVTDIPIAAVSLSGTEWHRIVVITGEALGRPELAADVRLTTEVASRFAAARSAAVSVLTPPSEPPPTLDGVPVVHASYEPGSGDIVSRFRPGDLLVVPVQVIAEAAKLDRARLRRALVDVSLVVVGGRYGLVREPEPTGTQLAATTPALAG